MDKMDKENKIDILDVDQFRTNLNMIIDQSKLPVWITYFILKDVVSEMTDIYNAQLNNELSARQAELAKQNADKDKNNNDNEDK